MPSVVLDGDPVPADGSLPADALAAVAQRPLSFYVHVPFCASRCGYCDFNTYTPQELGPGRGSSADAYVDAAVAEVRLARRVLGDTELPVRSVFFGGGTPTLLPPADLARLLGAVRDEFGLAPDAEVTTEANPETVDRAGFEALRAAGFTRISLGMQSAVPHVLATLERRHTPGRAVDAVADARAAGFEHVSLDLIYGTPGESAADWAESLDAALAADVDHVSAYALVVEDGTRMGAQVRRGELPMPEDDVAADRYLAADATFGGAGLRWYEVSNWARPGGECRHNLAYWRGDHWWGVGPGAHSHVGGTRWWNVKHPSAYSERLTGGTSPGLAREVLDAEAEHTEQVLLGIRLAEGLPLAVLDDGERSRLDVLATDGLVELDAPTTGRARLTLRGRLLADHVVRTLLV
jgi:putative oxygen-independent coproporphyrinogen III oxidase